jgi:hypothetical protein
MGFGGSSGGSSSLSGLSDASLNSPLNDDVLSYSSATQKWQNRTIPSSVAINPNYVRVAKTTDTSTTSSTTTTLDADLKVSVLANARYVFELVLGYEAAQNGDIKLGLFAPTSSTVFGLCQGVSAGTTLTTVADSPMTIQLVRTLNSGFGALGGVGVGTGVGTRITGTLTTGPTAGTFGLGWAQNTSSTTATILYTGSELSITRIG